MSLLRHRPATCGAGYGDVIGNLESALRAVIEGIASGAYRRVDDILALNARTEVAKIRFPTLVMTTEESGLASVGQNRARHRPA